MTLVKGGAIEADHKRQPRDLIEFSILACLSDLWDCELPRYFRQKTTIGILLRLLFFVASDLSANQHFLQNLNGAALARGFNSASSDDRKKQKLVTGVRFLFGARSSAFSPNCGVFIGASFIRVLVASSLIRAIGPSGVGLISACYGSSGAENPLPTQASFQSRLFWQATNREERARLSRGHFYPRNRPNAQASTYFKARTLPS